MLGLLVATLAALMLFSAACSGADPAVPGEPSDSQAEQQLDQQHAVQQQEAPNVRQSQPTSDQADEVIQHGMPTGLPLVANDPVSTDFLEYQTYPDGPYGFRSVLVVFAPTNHIDYDMMGLEYVCDQRIGLWILVVGYPSADGSQRNIAAPLNLDLGFAASAVFSGSRAGTDRYLEFDVLEKSYAQYSNGVEFMSTSKAHERVIVRLPFGDDYLIADFDLRGVFGTPIQPNLDACGDY